MKEINRDEFEQRFRPRWNEFFTMVDHIGPELNSRKNRFDKADLFEAALQEATGGVLKWVDEVGYDLIDSSTGDKYEAKSQGNCLYSPRGALKPQAGVIKLSNSLSKDPNHKPTEDADFLLIVDSKSYSAAIIPYAEVLEKYTTSLPDGFTCKIPSSALTFLTTPSEITLQGTESMVLSYATAKRNLQEQCVSAFFT